MSGKKSPLSGVVPPHSLANVGQIPEDDLWLPVVALHPPGKRERKSTTESNSLVRVTRYFWESDWGTFAQQWQAPQVLHADLSGVTELRSNHRSAALDFLGDS